MFNLKWCGVAAGFGFVLSFLVGIISGAGLSWALVRALIFGAAFFALAGGIWFLVNRFLPDLFSAGEDEAGMSGMPGSRVDISVGDEENAVLPSALPDTFQADEEPGNIADLLSGNVVSMTSPAGGSMRGMDQKGEEGYTENRESEFQTKAPDGAFGTDFAERTAAPAAGGSSGGAGSGEVLPDLDAMAEAFRPRGDEAAEFVSDRQPPPRSPGGGKGQSMAGDFNPKDLASAIQTILSKD
ncbi:MAG: hypothetical protein LBQ55_04660 [Treponema sp.]|jgi:hypothetical protein|nr:hypothetical protein [Treponema sp.]